VKFSRGDEVELAVEAADPNEGDTLRYTWTVDGVTVKERASSFVYRGGRSAVVRVTVEDGHQGSFTEEWGLVPVNRPPILSVVPLDPETELEEGQRLTFRVQAEDPDGDAIDTAFLVGGKRVASGSSYEYRAVAPGSYALEARVTDPWGATSRQERRIRVVSRTPEPPSPAPVAAAPPEDPKEVAMSTLREYAAAYEARSLDRLSRVWVMNPEQKDAMRELFDRVDDVAVRIDRPNVVVGNGMVFVHFDQSVEARGTRAMIDGGKPRPMTATLIPRGDGSWIISSILPRR
jgi:hypothetical protein